MTSSLKNTRFEKFKTSKFAVIPFKEGHRRVCTFSYADMD